MPTQIRASVTQDTFYKATGGSVLAGATYIIDAFPALFQRTMRDMRGVFDHGELMLMLDIHNGTLLTPGLAGQHIMASVKDAIELDGADKKWGVELGQIIDKLSALSVFDRACLELWAKAYWEDTSVPAPAYVKPMESM